MIAAGADAQQQAPSSCQLKTEVVTEVELDEEGEPHQRYDYDESEPYDEPVEHLLRPVPCAGRSAHSLVVILKKRMETTEYQPRYYRYEGEVNSINAWAATIGVLSALALIFEEALRYKKPPAKVSVPEGVVELWEAFRSDAASHDVTLVCAADERVTAHSRILSLASPALSAMLQSAMIEGATKSITISDCSAKSASLFLDLLYSGTTESDLDADAGADAGAVTTLLEALQLAHRWQIQPVVERTERELTHRISNRASFDAIATAAQQMALPALKSACRLFAAEPSNGIDLRLQSSTNPLPQAVRDLLSPPTATGSSAPPANKKRRSF